MPYKKRSRGHIIRGPFTNIENYFLVCEESWFGKINPAGDLMYYNTGCWTGTESPTYITVSLNGSVALQRYEKI